VGLVKNSIVKISKFLSYVLRHHPESIGLTLDREGWIEIDALLKAAGDHGRRIDRSLLYRVVAENDKKRFALSEDGTRIRASQGHSRPVDLGLKPLEPPKLLFHGTTERFLPSIERQGLVRGSRHHVHLSPDEKTAAAVGGRRGRPVVLSILSKKMHEEGHAFYCSANGVWLTDAVPADYIVFPKD
jgi:putative RNA 2'-phosphotransferase